jgi:hypothetical protein
MIQATDGLAIVRFHLSYHLRLRQQLLECEDDDQRVTSTDEVRLSVEKGGDRQYWLYEE